MKIKYASKIIYLILVGSLFACSKSPKCWGDDKNKGIIKESIQINGFPNTTADNYVVDSNIEYVELFTDTTGGIMIDNLPDIDFNENTLLGIEVNGQCNIKLISEVTSKAEDNTYLYKIIIKSCGLCKSAIYKINWITVPKLPNGWNVTFETVDK